MHFGLVLFVLVWLFYFFSSRRRHTRCALVTGVQTCALPIFEGLFFLLASFKKDGASTGSARTDHKIASGRKLRRIFVAIAVAQADLVDLFAAQLGERRVGQPDLRRHLEGREMFAQRSEEHTSELQSLMRISSAVFCLKKKTLRA